MWEQLTKTSFGIGFSVNGLELYFAARLQVISQCTTTLKETQEEMNLLSTAPFPRRVAASFNPHVEATADSAFSLPLVFLIGVSHSPGGALRKSFDDYARFE